MHVKLPSRSNVTASGVAQLYQDRIFSLRGIPDDIVPDRYIKFTSAFLHQLQRLSGTNLNMSTAYRPQTDGKIGRMKCVLEDMLRDFVSPDHPDWVVGLSLDKPSMNSCYKSFIQCTPFQLVY